MPTLAAACHRQGKLAPAEELWAGGVLAARARRRTTGAAHADSIDTAKDLAGTYAGLGRHAEAAELRTLYRLGNLGSWQTGSARSTSALAGVTLAS